MESMTLLMGLSFAVGGLILFLADLFWLSPLRNYSRHRRGGLDGPRPSFPLGNLKEMARKTRDDQDFSSSLSSPRPVGSSSFGNDIHPTVFPYFARWRKAYGKVFLYWLGTEPFLYVADPEFLKQATAGIMAKNWGKPDVFKVDRKPMFGDGLIMVEGNTWALHRNIISPAFSAPNLNAMMGMMVESTTAMIAEWSELVSSGADDIDVEKGVTMNAAEIIAKTSFGMSLEIGREIFRKLIALQMMLFRTNRLVGVPFSRLLRLKETAEAAELGREIDRLLLATIESRKNQAASGKQHDLLGLLLAGNKAAPEQSSQLRKLTAGELVDECKTFFFGGHETTALSVTWTLLMLAVHPEWQTALRDEINEAFGERSDYIDDDVLSKLVKMEWVFHEVLRLYPAAPNTQRQTREDIRVGDVVVPRGTNIWIDTVGMHHDEELWGEDAQEFKPERFRDSATGGCRHRMGFLPFGFGGRMCVGRNLTRMEYKITLCLVLRKFLLSVSPAYRHSPTVILSLRPTHGVRLILRPVEEQEIR